MNSSLATKSSATRKPLLGRFPLLRACVVVTAFFAFAAISRSQMPGSPPGQMGTSVPNQSQVGQSGGTMNDQLQYGTFGHQVERDQDLAYKTFLTERDPVKKVRLGNSFLQKYPKSPLAEQVDAGLMNFYRAQQDWKDTYLWADHALALNSDDVDVLTTVGWTIPHVYNPNDPNADQELDKAERYSKHALEVLARMPKPPDMKEAQFEAAKARRSFQAHSALGLIYFRRDDYANSAKELQQSINGNPTQDPTDLFVLGVDLQNLNRASEAADAFRGCSQIAGPLQDQCKRYAGSSGVQAAQSKTK
jgi:tetratricopeptide (TPR) repeat protein